MTLFNPTLGFLSHFPTHSHRSIPVRPYRTLVPSRFFADARVPRSPSHDINANRGDFSFAIHACACPSL